MCKIEENEKLIIRYPFLRVRNVWTGKPAYEDGQNKSTYLDHFPDGWRIAFGIDFCEEFLEAFNELNDENKENFYFTQIKEKFGGLRIYTSFGTKKMYDIISKYELLSEKICIKCGASAEYITRGWIMPFCGNCISDKTIDYCWTIEDYFKE